jgi:uncharacterized protein YjbI with pentapeptide repeats
MRYSSSSQVFTPRFGQKPPDIPLWFKIVGPVLTGFSFLLREDLNNGLDRFVDRQKFDRRTEFRLLDEKTSDAERVKTLETRDGWGLPVPRPDITVAEQESMRRDVDMPGSPSPIDYQTYTPSKPSLLKGRSYKKLLLPSTGALPVFWRPWFNRGTGWLQWRKPADFSGNDNTRLNHDQANLSNSNMPGVNFDDSSLRHVNATNANWSGGSFINTLLLKTGLFNTRLAGAVFKNTQGIPSSDPQFWNEHLERIWLEGKSRLQPMALTFQDFRNKLMDYATVKNVDWLGSDLSNGSLYRGKLAGLVRILGMNLTKTNLKQLHAPNQNWAGVNIDDTKMAGIQTPNSDFKSVRNAHKALMASTADHPGNYSNSDWRGQDLSNQDLQHNIYRDSTFSPVGEPVPRGKRPYRLKRWAVSRYLVPFTLRSGERNQPLKKLAKLLKDPTNKTASKIKNLALMTQPEEANQLVARDTPQSRKLWSK